MGSAGRIVGRIVGGGVGLVLVLGGVVFALVLGPTMRDESGREPGRAAAAQLRETLDPGSYTIVSDAMIEARPETLLELTHALQGSQIELRPVWKPKLGPGYPPNTLAMIRTGIPESEIPKSLIRETLVEGRVHDFSFAVVRLVEQDSD